MKPVERNISVTTRAIFSLRNLFVLLFLYGCLSAWGNVFADDFQDGIAQYEQGHYHEAFKLIKKVAETGNAEAEYKLALMYWYGKGVNVDYEQAFSWCKKAAHQDHMKAAYALSKMFQSDNLIEKDSQEAYYWFRRAAELDMENGRLAIALMYYKGTLVEKDVEAGLTWLQKAAEEENIIALTKLAMMYEKGENVEKNEATALVLFKKAAEKNVDHLISRDSALQSRAEAQYRLGKMIEDGRGGASKNKDVAIKWYKKAAADGNDEAEKRLEKMDIGSHYPIVFP